MGHKTDILQRWYDQVWTLGRLEVVDELFAAETRASGIMPDFAVDPDDFKKLVTAVCALCTPPSATILRAHEDGDWLSAHIEVRTTNLAETRDVKVTGMAFVRFQGDKMVETYNNFDFLNFFEQLGQLPDGSLGLLLAGSRLD